MAAPQWIRFAGRKVGAYVDAIIRSISMRDQARMSIKSRYVPFVCIRKKLRSPTAEQVFSARDDIEVSSVGTNNDACNPLDAEQVEWADIIFVMEKAHRSKITCKFRKSLNGERIICLDIR
ncbi:putative protein tyrosine phosphatase [Rhizobium sp. BK316]|nr:putative protein tyrosine phosphatase [Rhizobium sp. BK316]